MVYIIIKIYIIYIYYEIYIYIHFWYTRHSLSPNQIYMLGPKLTPDSSPTSCGTLHGPGEGAFLVKIGGVERLIGVFFLQIHHKLNGTLPTDPFP